MNVEEIVFTNQEVTKQLPEFKPHFDKWKLSKMIPGMRTAGQKAMLELLSALNEDHIEIIERIINKKLTIKNNLGKESVITDCINVESANNYFNELEFDWNLTASREGNQLYLCLWK